MAMSAGEEAYREASLSRNARLWLWYTADESHLCAFATVGALLSYLRHACRNYPPNPRTAIDKLQEQHFSQRQVALQLRGCSMLKCYTTDAD